MANSILELKHWLSQDQFYFVDGPNPNFEVREDVPGKFRFRIYTDTNWYSVTAVENDKGGYLGCIAKCRKPRAGEDWHRGNDLPDGHLTLETYRNIFLAIVRYELVKVHRTKPGQDKTPPFRSRLGRDTGKLPKA